MIQEAATAIAAALAATTDHRRHGALIGLVVLLVIVGLAYYAWRQRRLRRQAQNDRH